MINLCWNIPTLPMNEYTSVFVQAHYLLIIRLQQLTLYSSIKLMVVVTGLFVTIIQGCRVNQTFIWAILYSLLQMFNIQYQQLQKQHLVDIQKTQIIAASLGQLTDIQEQGIQMIPRSQIEKMMQSIKSAISVIDKRINTQARFLILSSQILILKFIYNAVFPQFAVSKSNSFLYHGNCDDYLLNVVHILFVLLILEYLVLYLFVALLILSIPFISIYLSYKKISKLCRLYRLRRKLTSFIQHPYSGKEDLWVLEEHECRICMMDYVEGEQLMQLPCNTLHHFHSTCIKEWLKVSIECPLCRSKLVNIQNFELQEFQLR